jgi:hypothetical protein
MGRRSGAWILDFVFAGILFVLAFRVSVDGYRDIPGNLCDDQVDTIGTNEDAQFCEADLLGKDGYAIYDSSTRTSTFFEADQLWVAPLVFVGYGVFTFVLVEGLVGASLGKLLLGVRVVRSDGSRAGLGRSLLRFLLWIFDAIPYCFPLVAVVAGFATKGHRRLGDMAAGTFVVATRDVGTPLSIPGLTPPAPYPAAPAVPYGTPSYGTPSFEPYGTPTYDSPSYGATPPAPEPTPAAPTTTEAPPGQTPSNEPQWDPQRNTHIQWDPARNAWLQWDAVAEEWKPIE